MAGLTFFMLPRSPTHLTDCRKNKGSTMASSSAKLNLTKSKSRAEIQLLQRLDPTIPVTCSADLCENHQGMTTSAPLPHEHLQKQYHTKSPKSKPRLENREAWDFNVRGNRGEGENTPCPDLCFHTSP